LFARHPLKFSDGVHETTERVLIFWK